jgi:glycerol-3-phosphate dehydrogenase
MVSQGRGEGGGGAAARPGDLDLRDRRASFAALEAEVFDLLVVGAGITGCGVARDAASRGLRVALVEAADLAAGTSGRSSKLVHGGLHYLVRGEVGIVREAARERLALRRIAPHLAAPMPIVIPARSRLVRAGLRAVMAVYERLGQVAPAERHEAWDRARLTAEEPALDASRLSGAVVYPEYLTDDARLTVANARSAAASGAVVVSYAAVESFVVERGEARGAVVRDTLPGADRAARVRARVVVNAAGPWVDAVRRLADRAAPAEVQLTKGVHVVVERRRLPLRRVVLLRSPDRRTVFAVPRGRFAYLGTTDTFYPGPDRFPAITAADVSYLLESARRTLRVEPLGRGDVVAVWSGLRPLLGRRGEAPAEISRRHAILEGPAGLVTIAGGKLTSYRKMAELVVDRCLARLPQKAAPSRTESEPLPGGDLAGSLDAVRERLGRRGLSADEAARAASLYGSEAELACAGGVASEAEHAVLREGCLRLEDYWARRAARAYFDDEGGEAALAPAAERMGALLGWSPAEREREREACRARRASDMRVVREAK